MYKISSGISSLVIYVNPITQVVFEISGKEIAITFPSGMKGGDKVEMLVVW